MGLGRGRSSAGAPPTSGRARPQTESAPTAPGSCFDTELDLTRRVWVTSGTGKAARYPSAAVPLASASWELAALAYLAGARPAPPALSLALLYSAAAISSSGCERCRWPDCCLLFSEGLLKPRSAGVPSLANTGDDANTDIDECEIQGCMVPPPVARECRPMQNVSLICTDTELAECTSIGGTNRREACFEGLKHDYVLLISR